MLLIRKLMRARLTQPQVDHRSAFSVRPLIYVVDFSEHHGDYERSSKHLGLFDIRITNGKVIETVLSSLALLHK